MNTMIEKKYKITTTAKKFETDNDGPDYLKEENGVFYAREKETEKWDIVKKIEKITNVAEKIIYPWLYLFNIFFLIIVYHLFDFTNNKDNVSIFFLFGYCGIPWCWVGLLGILIKYYEHLSDKEIKKLVEYNKWHSRSPSSNSYKNRYSRSGHYSGVSSKGYSSGGSSGGGYSGYSSNYISSSDLDKALKDIESKGKSWEDLANFTTDEEREKLFAEYFKDKEKGEAANDKFNREQLGPARKRTLNKIFAEAEYEDDETKENLKEKIDNFDNTISNNEFQTTVKEIRKFQERKKLKDNHIKYEGRLSNKDIKAIKDVLGYVCMGCGLDPVKEYGVEMKGILEAHHKTPWAEIKENEVRTVEPNDFYILCPNCHRMIHRLDSPDDLDGLKEVLNQNKKSHWWD